MSGYTGLQSRPSIFNNVASLTMNFDSSRVAIGNIAGVGMVSVFDYDVVFNTWSIMGSPISGPAGANSHFGQSIDMDWSGNRLVVGANTVSRVYVYDYSEGSWSGSQTIESPSGAGSDFGFSISISKDIPDTLAVGSPLHNNVFVYQFLNTTWSLAFSNTGTDIFNIAPTTENFYVLKPEYNRYGESVRLSSLGDYLIVGQPGTVLAELNSTNTIGITAPTTVNVSSLVTTEPGEYTASFGVNQNRQQGSARIFKTNNSWLVSNEQVGSLLRPDINCHIGDISQEDFGAGWSFPGFGMQVDISSNGNLVVVTAPLFSVNGGDYTYHNGQIYTFIYTETGWMKQDVFTGLKQAMFGKSMKLDYTGERIIISGSNLRLSVTNVSDWNGNSWYGVEPDIVRSITTLADNQVYITNGEIAMRSINTTTSFFTYLLTQSIIGNNLIRGYLAADELFIGANDNNNEVSGKFSKTKRISFGGTYLDNTYEGATIENRQYKIYETGTEQGNEGRSELFVAKTNQILGQSESGGVDLIRLKANEIHLDAYSLYNDYDNKFIQDPLLVLNYQKNVSIGLPFFDGLSGEDNFFRGTINTKAKLDVNGSTYVRNRLNVNVDGGNNILGNAGEQPNILFDTRNQSSVVGATIFSNTMVDNRIYNSTGTIVSPALYSNTQSAFYITGDGGYVSVNNINVISNFMRVSLWFKLTILPTVDTLICFWGTIDTNNKYFAIYATSTGFKIVIANNDVATYTVPFSLTVNEWVHITGYYESPNFNPLFDFHVNGQVTSPSISGTLPTSLSFTNDTFTIGGGSNMYIGMVMIWSGYAFRSPTAQNLYENGPPSEMLKVGGDTVVTGKLGIGTTNPSTSLEVNGIIKNNNPRFYAKNESGGVSTSSSVVLNVFDSVLVNTGNYYDAATSRFTAPVSGVYIFKFSGLHRFVTSSGSCELTFAKNGTKVSTRGVSYTYVTATSDHDYNPAEIMLNLVVNDYIEPFIDSITPGTDLYYGGGLSHFSGHFMG